MIAVDTSSLMAIARDEPSAAACLAVLASHSIRFISAGTLTETLIVAARKGVLDRMQEIFAQYPMQVVPVDEATALRCAQAYDRYGKGIHPAALNLADTFAYDLARTHNCPLLYIGNDFSQTDILPALHPHV